MRLFSIFVFSFVLLVGTRAAVGAEIIPKRVGSFFDWKSSEERKDADHFTNREVNFPEILITGSGPVLIGVDQKGADVGLRLTRISDLLLEKNSRQRLFEERRVPSKTAGEKKSSWSNVFAAAALTSVRASYGHGIFRVQGRGVSDECQSTSSLIVVRAGKEAPAEERTLSCEAWSIAVPVDGRRKSEFLLADEAMMQRVRVGQGKAFQPIMRASLNSWLPEAKSIISMDVSLGAQEILTLAVIYADASNQFRLCTSRWDPEQSPLPTHRSAPCHVMSDIVFPVAVRLNETGSMLGVVEREVRRNLNHLKIMEFVPDEGRFRHKQVYGISRFPVEISDIKGQSYLYFQSMHWLGDQLFWISQGDDQRLVVRYDRATNDVGPLAFQKDGCTAVEYRSPHDDSFSANRGGEGGNQNGEADWFGGLTLGKKPFQETKKQSIAELVPVWEEVVGRPGAFAGAQTIGKLFNRLMDQNIFFNRPAWLPVSCRPPEKVAGHQAGSLQKALEFIDVNWIYPFNFNSRPYIAASIIVRVQADGHSQSAGYRVEPVVRMAIMEVATP